MPVQARPRLTRHANPSLLRPPADATTDPDESPISNLAPYPSLYPFHMPFLVLLPFHPTNHAAPQRPIYSMCLPQPSRNSRLSTQLAFCSSTPIDYPIQLQESLIYQSFFNSLNTERSPIQKPASNYFHQSQVLVVNWMTVAISCIVPRGIHIGPEGTIQDIDT